ncbi:MAG: hypothetical protein VB857_09145, partial [Pirellulaceae bacterium]
MLAMLRRCYWILLIPCLLLVQDSSVVAQEEFKVQEHYVKSSHMIAMRDDVKLFTIVYKPKRSDQKYPIMLFRTPYSIGPYEPDRYRSSLGPSQPFAEDGHADFGFTNQFRNHAVFGRAEKGALGSQQEH